MKAYLPKLGDMQPAANQNKIMPVVTDTEANDPVFHSMIRNMLYDLTQRYGLMPGVWRAFLLEILCAYDGRFMDKTGEVILNTELLEIDEDTLFNGTAADVANANEAICARFEMLCCQPCPPRPRFRSDFSREFFKLTATTIKTLKQEDALFFALKVKASNDNFPPE